MRKFLWLIMAYALFTSCHKTAKSPVLFEMLDSSKTGLVFANTLTATDSFNVFKYMYFYNGAGVATADFNNDGWMDIFFCGNQKPNTLYINKKENKFEDVTAKTQIVATGHWYTGASVIDINNDGLLDIYLCKVSKLENLRGANELLICTGIKDGIPSYKDSAAEYGLNFSGYSTQAVFFDYDVDGDLDMYLLNHSVHQNGTFAERSLFLGKTNDLSGDRLYKNSDGKFVDVTAQSGINSNAIGYGLGVAVQDVNIDGYPDIYIGNDFHENDYLYINQKNGTFQEQSSNWLDHTSQFTMGVDIADVTNDGYPEIISADMLPEDPYILKRSLGEDEYTTFYMKIRYGYSYQYTRNNLQLNRRNNRFSEVGLYSGVYASDWSWSPLWLDFNNDGKKDLFVSNGIPKRLNDIDYVNYISNDAVQATINQNKIDEKQMAVINQFPQIKIPNKFYINQGDALFSDAANSIQNDANTFSNGAAYADFDNDGDVDVVVNNIDAAAMLYENKTRISSSDTSSQHHYIKFDLQGAKGNEFAIGAKILLYINGSIQTAEMQAVHGFQSSMLGPVHMGIAGSAVPDSVLVIWPNNTYQQVPVKQLDTVYKVQYTADAKLYNYANYRLTKFNNATPIVRDVADSLGVNFTHTENPFNEFDREPLIPHMVSREGPALAVGDYNKDGLEDFFIGNSKGNKPALYTQTSQGSFVNNTPSCLINDSTYEDVDAVFADINNDGWNDLLVASGGNEYYGSDKRQQPRLYMNNKGILTPMPNAFSNVFTTAACLVVWDVNGDGWQDVFIGSRAVVYNYGEQPKSYVLLNQKNGTFASAPASFQNALNNIGFVTDAKLAPIGKNKENCLVISTEWGGIYSLQSTKNALTVNNIFTKNGLWNAVIPTDVDNDGDIDIIAGNIGLNSRLKASEKEPIQLYYNDFDGNGVKEQVLTYFLNGKQIPFANKAELEKQMPLLKKKFLYAEDFAKSQLENLFGKEKLDQATQWKATELRNTLLINQGGVFKDTPLPYALQLSPLKCGFNYSSNNYKAVLLAGNYFENNIQMGRYDAEHGTWFQYNNTSFATQVVRGYALDGQVRHIQPIQVKGKLLYLVARNNDKLALITVN
ncbi:MAG: hypothetical protein EAZ47_04555 [Bacteroidetes bacterium]|nr:MAG: hypothetical protein EAY72_01020 [Bacteroidota bacterium]TAE72613.1 MAG: hypothetical protein EAY68_00795 [Bacteroidota bacterium]TAF94169.1 MAG: hypothetical protein EAZ47_04555 [Bacteroidota bacterium]